MLIVILFLLYNRRFMDGDVMWKNREGGIGYGLLLIICMIGV
jgi:hypothetical protein